MSVGPEYEFTKEQNDEISGLAHKMRWVGLFFIILGVLGFIAAILVVTAIYQNELPPEWVQQVPPEVQERVSELPPRNELWGHVINFAVSGLIYLLIGVWTRSAAGSFQKIVDTRGNDITNLMNGMGALHKMYGLIYLLLVIALILFLVGVGLALYQRFGA